MDEDIKNELLAILRGLRDGAPDAFNELVAQRSAYCLTHAVTMGAVALLCVVVIVVTVPRLIRAVRMPRGYHEYQTIKTMEPGAFATAMICGIAAGLSFFAFCMLLAGTFQNLAEGMAPLGRVLEMLR